MLKELVSKTLLYNFKSELLIITSIVVQLSTGRDHIAKENFHCMIYSALVNKHGHICAAATQSRTNINREPLHYKLRLCCVRKSNIISEVSGATAKGVFSFTRCLLQSNNSKKIDTFSPDSIGGTLTNKIRKSKAVITNYLNIGDVSLHILRGNHPEKVASGLPPIASIFFNPRHPETLGYLRWIAQKELLNQDICIIGDPGPTKRWLAMTYAQIAQREVQFMSLSRDTTEADIKQRKEIHNGTLFYVNQPAVTASLEGQMLIIDGLERAERNVLPVINNLLENREMHLDNGMMLIHPQRYDQLCKEHRTDDLTHLGLLRVSENFRVVGLTVPVPKFSGNPLDPPLRSRFQCLFLHSALSQSKGYNSSGEDGSSVFSSSIRMIPKSIQGTTAAETMLKFRTVQNSVDDAGSDRDRIRSMPCMSDFELFQWASQHAKFPCEDIGEILQRVYPWELFIRMGPKSELPSKRQSMQRILNKYSLLSLDSTLKIDSIRNETYTVNDVEEVGVRVTKKPQKRVTIKFSDGSEAKGVPAGNLHLHSVEKLTNSYPLGKGSKTPAAAFFMPSHRRVIQGMIQSHAYGRHIALCGSTGCGKTIIVREFASLLGYEVETQHLYSDMSTRDLLQRRCTDPKTGNTTWELSTLMQAAKDGKLAVLDGIDQLTPGSLAVLQELLLDGNITLFDGTVFKNSAAFENLKEELGLQSDEEMAANGVYRLHPSFLLIATCRYPTPDSGAKKTWLSSDLLPLFNWHVLPDLSSDACAKVLSVSTERFALTYTREIDGDGVNLRAVTSSVVALTARQQSKQFQSVIAKLVTLQQHLAEMAKTEVKTPTLTLRQLIHISKHALIFPDDLQGIVESALLVPLLSQLLASQVRQLIVDIGIVQSSPSLTSLVGKAAKKIMGSSDREDETNAALIPQESLSESQKCAPFCVVHSGHSKAILSFGAEILRVSRSFSSKESAFVPFVPNFNPNREQQLLQTWIAKNIASANNVLIVGNQGVGKNKVVDQFLMEAKLPRHYLQLHRDTTVSSLTINPTVIDGKVIWEDSPLVKATQNGHILVVDEIDKAPVEVVHILKGLIEDKEMKLGDGRKISGWSDDIEGSSPGEVIPIHKDFRIIVLANPPGFPFHGNDFYRECGDLFSCYVMQNPDPDSQIDILRNIAPHMPPVIITQLVNLFFDLGELFRDGILQYPFSLRELIAIVKHLNRFPKDGIYQALNNVFNFDLLDVNTINHVRRLLHQHLSSISDHQLRAALLPNQIAQELELGKLERMATFSISTGDGFGDNAKGRVKSVVHFVEAPRGEKSIPIPIDIIGDTLPWSAESESSKDIEVKSVTKTNNTNKTISSGKNSAKKIVEHANGNENEVFSEALGGVDISHVLDISHQEVITSVKQLPAGAGTNLAHPVTAALTSKGKLILFNTSSMQRVKDRQVKQTVACLDLSQHIKGSWDILGASSLLTSAVNKGYRDISKISTSSLTDDDVGDCEPHLQLLDPISGTILAIPIESCLIRIKDIGGACDNKGSISMVSSLQSVVNDTTNTSTDVRAFADVKIYRFIPNKCGEEKSVKPILVASQLATEGFLSCNFLTCVRMLYYGRSIDLFFTSDGDSSTRYTVLKFEPFSSQLAFIALVVNDQIQLGFVKITAFHNSVVADFNPIRLADVQRPHDEKDKRRRFTKDETMKLLLSDGSFTGFGREEGYVPSVGPLSQENLNHALFVMSPSSFQSAEEKQNYTTADTDTPVTVKKGDVLYALASVEYISETDMLMTLNGFVNTFSGDLQLCGNSNSSKAIAIPGITDLKEAPITTVSCTSPWQKVGEAGMRAVGEVGSSGFNNSATSPSTQYAHQQLAAVSYRGSDGNPSVHVVSTHKGTIRTFDPAKYVSSPSSQSIYGALAAEVRQSVSNTIKAIPSNTVSPVVSRLKSSINIGADGYGASVSNNGTSISSFDANSGRLQETYSRWSTVLKGGGGAFGGPPTPEDLTLSYSKPRKTPNADNLKRGEEDPDNDPHVGGNNWAGGSGGTDTAGLGGLVGPYRLDKGHPVTQVDPEEKKKVPKHIIEEAKKMGQEALKKRLDEINMSVNDDRRYQACFERVQGPIQQLQSLLQGLKNKETERAWVRHQTDGVWDDSKIVEGITGEKTVYKRRTESETSSLFGKPQTEESKKRLLFVLDVSASMYRFNGMDGRLSRLVECAVMIMESFRGHEDKIDYAIVGHSGDSDELPLVEFGRPPTNNKERMDVTLRMVAYSQHCWSGDNTVQAMRKSVRTVRKKKAENYFVFVISDANLAQYGISPKDLSRIIKSDELVQMFCIFIASFGQQAKQIQRHLPTGHGFECLDAAELPLVLKQIFTATDVLS